MSQNQILNHLHAIESQPRLLLLKHSQTLVVSISSLSQHSSDAIAEKVRAENLCSRQNIRRPNSTTNKPIWVETPHKHTISLSQESDDSARSALALLTQQCATEGNVDKKGERRG